MVSFSPPFLSAITLLHERLKDLPHPWAFTGSVGMTLQGMDLPVHDIDVQSDRDGTYAIADRFAENIIRPVAYSGTEVIRSHLGALDLGGVKVELIGDVEGRLPGGDWTVAPYLPELVRWVEYAGMRLPAIDLEYEYRAYLRMRREARAALIRAFLDGKAG